MRNVAKLNAARRAIEAVFSHMNQSRQEALDALRELADEIEADIAALQHETEDPR